MNRELIVALLKKNIDDLILLTEGFEQMTTYPDALIQLAQLKTNDIKQYLYELGDLKHQQQPVEVVIHEPELQLETETDVEVKSEEIVVPELKLVTEEETVIETKDADVLEIPYEDEDEDEDEEDEEVEDHEDRITEVENEMSEDPEPEPRKTILGESINNGITRNDVHSSREPERFNNAMANKKIDDIRQAISIGDRFRFQRELFRNNGEEMNKMLSYINLLASYNEIEVFLQKKYAWDADNEAARDFYAIVRRKFI